MFVSLFVRYEQGVLLRGAECVGEIVNKARVRGTVSITSRANHYLYFAGIKWQRSEKLKIGSNIFKHKASSIKAYISICDFPPFL